MTLSLRRLRYGIMEGMQTRRQPREDARPGQRLTDRVFVVVDLETTGLSAARDAIIEVGAVRIDRGVVTDRYTTLVNPKRHIPLQIQQITGICNEDVVDAPSIQDVAAALIAFVDPSVAAIVAHNASFDLGFLRAAGIDFQRPALDTVELAAILLPGMASYSLGELCRALNIPLSSAHRAADDAAATGELLLRLLERIHSLPEGIIATLLERGQAVEWPPLMLFADAARTRRLTGRPAPRTDVWADGTRPEDHAAETPVLDASPPPQSVDPRRIDELLDEGGALAARLGDRYERRAGQLEMAHQVLDAFNRSDHLLIEAGTGVGKSLAYLAPAALWSMQNRRRTVIATYTLALQSQLVDKDLPQLRDLLRDRGADELTWALLKGRSNYLCLRRLHGWMQRASFSPRELSFLAKVLVWRATTRDGDVRDLFLPSKEERMLWREVCSHGASCTPERCRSRPGWRDYYLDAQAQAACAHLLVVNHALLLADRSAGGRVLPSYAHLVVDEAHHLEDAATEQLTYTVDWAALQRHLRRLTAGGDLLPQALALLQASRNVAGVDALRDVEQSARQTAARLDRFAGILNDVAQVVGSPQQSNDYAQRLAIDGRLRSQPVWSEVEIEADETSHTLRTTVARLEALLRQLEQAQWPEYEPQATSFAELRSAAGELNELLVHLDAIVLQSQAEEARGAVAWLEIPSRRDAGRRDVRLAVAPLHVGEQLETALLHRCRTAVFTGATLRTADGFGFLSERLGLWDVATSTVESPFDYERSTLLCLPSDLPPPNHPHYQAAVEDAILRAALTAGGRTLALFTSYAQLRTTANALRAPLDHAGITLLEQGGSSRSRLLRAYQATEQAVLLGTRSFWEGIDLAGEQLSVLFIVRLPFAVPGEPLTAARSAEFDNAFRDYALPAAILRFRQGFGRLIRRGTDRGVVVLLDSRIWQKSYGRSFLDALPSCTQRRAPLADLGAEIDLWLHRAKAQ